MSGDKGFRLGALACCVVYIFSFLFLPYITVKFTQIGVSGLDCMSVSFWAYLVLIAGIAAAVCSMVAEAKTAAVVCLVAAFITLVSFFLIRADAAGLLGNLVGGGASSSVTMGINIITTLGFGPVISILCGIGGAVLCFLSENASKPRTITPGISSNSDDEW